MVSISNSCQLPHHQIHDYRWGQPGQDYYLEIAAEAGSQQKFYMTGWGKPIQLNDLILLREGNCDCCFTVKQVEPYYNIADLWTALLQKNDIELIDSDLK